MRLFAGLNATDYQDILRAVGLHIDEMGLRSIRIVEVEDGLVIQGIASRDSGRPASFETLKLTDDDLREILLAAYKRRRAGSPAASPE